MKILWVTKKYFDTAQDRTTWLEMVRHLQLLGYEVTLITGFRHEQSSFGLGGAVKYVPSIKRPGLNAISFLLLSYAYAIYYMVKRKPDIVILGFWTFWIGFPVDLISKFLKKPKFFIDLRTFHYGIESDTFSVMDHILRFLTDVSLLYNKYLHAGITVITPELKRQIVDRYKLREDRVGLWASGVSVEKFNPEAVDTGHIPEGLMKLRDKFVVIHHGSLSFNRGLLETVEAVSHVCQKHPDIVFLLLGDGTAKGEILSLAEKLGLHDNFYFAGQVGYDSVPSYIQLSHVGIMAYPNIEYWKVNNPIKLLEYFAMEKPVIVRDMITFRDVTGSHACCIFIDSNEPANIAKGIQYAYDRRDRLREMGRAGRKIVVDRYTWRGQAKSLDEFLRSFF